MPLALFSFHPRIDPFSCSVLKTPRGPPLSLSLCCFDKNSLSPFDSRREERQRDVFSRENNTRNGCPHFRFRPPSFPLSLPSSFNLNNSLFPSPPPQKKTTQTASGAVACQLMDALHPGSVNLSRVDFNSRSEYDSIGNYKALQAALRRRGSTSPSTSRD